MDKIKEILDFWFEGIDDKTPINKNASPFKKWFVKDPKFDQLIRDKFEKDLEAAQEGIFKSWENSPQGVLALILLFDQFSRNLTRDSPRAFACDHLALKLAQEMVKEGTDKDLPLIYRVFVYMPFMHAENLEIQNLGVKCFEELVTDSKKIIPQNTLYFEYNLSYSRKHQEIIQQFGRFPHRNTVLNRPSSSVEIEFLKKKNSSF